MSKELKLIKVEKPTLEKSGTYSQFNKDLKSYFEYLKKIKDFKNQIQSELDKKEFWETLKICYPKLMAMLEKDEKLKLRNSPRTNSELRLGTNGLGNYGSIDFDIEKDGNQIKLLYNLKHVKDGKEMNELIMTKIFFWEISNEEEE